MAAFAGFQVKKAFYALVYNGVRSAPLWDTTEQDFVGTYVRTSLAHEWSRTRQQRSCCHYALFQTGLSNSTTECTKVSISCNDSVIVAYDSLFDILHCIILPWLIYICLCVTGMLTITDFIKILKKYYKSPLVSVALRLHERVCTCSEIPSRNLVHCTYMYMNTSSST